MKNCNKARKKNLKGLLNLIRVTKMRWNIEHKGKYKQEDWTNFGKIKIKKLQNLSCKLFRKPAKYKILLGTNS